MNKTVHRPEEASGVRENVYLLKVVDHEEDVGVAHLGLLPFAVHGVFTGRREHLLKEDDKGHVGHTKTNS